MNNDTQALDAHTRFLMTVHAQHPGLTERSIGAARTPDGLTSYEAFGRFVDPQPGMTVVDLACGNGPLCEILAERVGPAGCVVGVDLSDAELKLAGERLGGYSNVRLLKASAAKLPLPDATADLVVCHMAFMLFTPLAQAVEEIGRVLKPGGTFAAVIPTLRKPTDLFRECAGVLRSVLADEKRALEALSGNAVKMNSVADLTEIFAVGGWQTETIATVDIDVSIAARPEALAERVAPAFYHYQLLSDEARGRVGLRWTELFKRYGTGDGTARFHFPLAAFAIRK
jgi:SAM-dependent methyltransferase